MGAFWRPGRPGEYARWWARCDLCHWSGPIQRFTVWADMLHGLETTICEHYWCDNSETEVNLRALGFSRGPEGYRGGK